MNLLEKTFRPSFSLKKGFLLISGLTTGYALWFCLLLLTLNWVNPPFTAFMLQYEWEKNERDRYSLRESWVKAEKIPEHLKLAVIASEDQLFMSHWGLDTEAIKKALEENERGTRIRGASTITQQVAKNLFLSPAQSYMRKGVEAGIAVMIDLLWTKDRILEVYLNVAEFGPGMYGIATATDFYYNKPVFELDPEESARMATVLPSPKRIEPVPASAYVLKRSKWILRNMEQLSGKRYLPDTKRDTVSVDPKTFDVSRLIRRVSLSDTVSLSGL